VKINSDFAHIKNSVKKLVKWNVQK